MNAVINDQLAAPAPHGLCGCDAAPSSSPVRLSPLLENVLRTMINPAYENVLGTESHERKVLLSEIDWLRAENIALKQRLVAV
ncbi:MAG: hypothetical protein ABI574_19295 [Burkholderiales bacterium]